MNPQANSWFPTIAITPGEPAGIGPDLVLLLAQQSLPCRLAVLADPDLLRQRAEQLRVDVCLDDWCQQAHRPGHLALVPVFVKNAVRSGELDPDNSAYVLKSLDLAVDGCLRGEFDAMVTGPVHKGIINDAGIAFTGHTEYLAQRTDSKHPVMVLIAGDLRVALVTTHLPLSEVPRAINRSDLRAVIEVLHNEIGQLCGNRQPRIAVCGLNPHAGENGHLGREDTEIIQPVIAECKQQGWPVSGPHSADTVFTSAQRRQFDVILTMYHDQGLPVLKAMGFGNAVNVTLGLPLIRTSVDHGTALHLAGSGEIDPGSLLAALSTALDLARGRRHSA